MRFITIVFNIIKVVALLWEFSDQTKMVSNFKTLGSEVPSGMVVYLYQEIIPPKDGKIGEHVQNRNFSAQQKT